MEDFVSLKEAAQIMAERGEPMSADWIRKKAVKGDIEGAHKIASVWIVPRKWAETYVKIKMGRPRKS